MARGLSPGNQLSPPAPLSADPEDLSQGKIIIDDEEQHHGSFLCVLSILKPSASRTTLNSWECAQASEEYRNGLPSQSFMLGVKRDTKSLFKCPLGIP